MHNKYKFTDRLINGQEAHLWLTATNSLPTGCDEQLYQQITSSEQAHYNALRMPTVKREYLITRALIRRALSNYVDVAPLDWEFVKNANGRPQLAPPFSSCNLNFNISHSRGAIACVITCGHQVGLDIEHQDRKAEFFDFADMVLTPYEQNELKRLKEVDFLCYWTLKEAYSKALGLGLGMEFKDIVCMFGEGRDSVPPGYTELSPDKWQLIQTTVLQNHLLALAIEKATPDDVEVRIVDCGNGINIRSELLLENKLQPCPRLLVKQS